VDDSTLTPDPAPGDEPVLLEPAAPPAPPAPGGGLARSAALVLLGLLAGLGAGWVLFRSEPGAGRAPGGEVEGVAQAHGVDITNDPVMGPPDAPITIVEFSDFDCPFCTRFATQTAPRLRQQYGENIRWVFVNYPLQSIHPRAYDAALAGECAHDEGRFWQFYDTMFSGRFDSSSEGLGAAAGEIGLDVDRFMTCLGGADHAQEVAADLMEAQKFYIFGTPTFFVNGHRLEGAQPAEAFAAVIDSILGGS
jgi:protein-disulfide isomerase